MTKKEYFGCTVKAWKIEGDWWQDYPWRFSVEHEGTTHTYSGVPNYCHSRASALKRGWYRAKWLSEGTHEDKYTELVALSN